MHDQEGQVALAGVGKIEADALGAEVQACLAALPSSPGAWQGAYPVGD